MCVCVCARAPARARARGCMGFVMCRCVYVWVFFDNYLGVLVICVLVFTVFCIVILCTFILICYYCKDNCRPVKTQVQ